MFFDKIKWNTIIIKITWICPLRKRVLHLHEYINLFLSRYCEMCIRLTN